MAAPNPLLRLGLVLHAGPKSLNGAHQELAPALAGDHHDGQVSAGLIDGCSGGRGAV